MLPTRAPYEILHGFRAKFSFGVFDDKHGFS